MTAEYLSIHKEPYNIIPRNDLLGPFADTLSRIRRRGPIISNMMEWWGEPGIGKSELTRQAVDLASEQGSSVALIDYAKYNVDSWLQDPVLALEEVATQMGLGTNGGLELLVDEYRSTGLPEEGVVSAYNHMDKETWLYRKPEWLNNLMQVFGQFISDVHELGQESSLKKHRNVIPAVLLFDNLDYAPVELLDFIELFLINPMSRVKHGVVGWVVERPWRVNIPSFKRGLTTSRIPPLDSDSIGVFLDIEGEDLQLVMELSGGIPGVAKLATERLVDTEDMEEPDRIQYLTKVVFDEVVMKEFSDNLPNNEARIVAKLLGVQRLVSTPIIERIAKAIRPDLFEDWETEDFQQINLSITHSRMASGMGSALRESLRLMINNYYVWNESETLVQLNRVALEYYREVLEKNPDRPDIFILEELYHLSWLVGFEDNAFEQIQECLESRLDMVDHNTSSMLIEAIAKDQELARMMDVGTLIESILDRG